MTKSQLKTVNAAYPKQNTPIKQPFPKSKVVKDIQPNPVQNPLYQVKMDRNYSIES